jgi:hypothetical protein
MISVTEGFMEFNQIAAETAGKGRAWSSLWRRGSTEMTFSQINHHFLVLKSVAKARR